MKKLFWSFGLPVIIVLIVSSCRKEFKAPEWETELFTPLLRAKLGWADLLTDSTLEKNKDNSLNFVYRKNILDFSTDTLLDIPDTKIDTSYRVPGLYMNFLPGKTIIDYQQDTKLTIKEVELRKIKLKSGFLVIKVKSYVSEKIKARFQLPGAKLDNKSFNVGVLVPKRVAADIPGEITSKFDLKGYTVDLTGKKGNTFNTVIFGVALGIDSSATSEVQVFSRDTLIFTCSFENIVPDYGAGYLGQNNFTLSSKLEDFDFVKNVSGKLALDSVKLVLNVENGVGADARVKINQLSALNSSTSNSVELKGKIMTQALNISRALKSADTFIPSNQSFSIYSGNSNINEFIQNLPDKLNYTISASFNPLGNISGGNDFIYETSKLRISAYLQIPLRFSTQDLTLIKDIDYSIISSDPNIKKGNLYLYADNGFPFNATIQLYLLNDNGSIIDSLMTRANTIQSAVIDGSNRAAQKTQTRLVIPVDEAKLKLLYDRKKIKAKMKLNTANYPSNIVMYDNYNMDLRLVGDFMYNVNLK